jgi:thiamine-phosphate pyrophosphorylase
VLADDDPRWPAGPVEQARAACAGGAAVVQLRCKRSRDGEILAWAHEIRRLTREAGVTFLVNDRFDLALLADADGVHLGQEDLPPERLPADARERLLVGRSTHDEAELARACAEPIDYVAYGPIFGTTTKEVGHAARGLHALREAARRVAPRPLVAIGGLDAASLPAVIAAGARGAAVISAVAAAADPEAAARRLATCFASAGAPA